LFVSQGQDEAASFGDLAWPQANWQEAAGRLLHGVVFLLEELVLHLEENANPRFLRLGEGLTILQQEIIRWVAAGGGRL